MKKTKQILLTAAILATGLALCETASAQKRGGEKRNSSAQTEQGNTARKAQAKPPKNNLGGSDWEKTQKQGLGGQDWDRKPAARRAKGRKTNGKKNERQTPRLGGNDFEVKTGNKP